MSIFVPRPPRSDAHCDVEICAGESRFQGVIVNFHDQGARVQSSSNVSEGAEIGMTISGADVLARVIWCKPGTFGVSFLDPIPPEVVEILSTSNSANGDKVAWKSF